jgi:hypothetical protein
MTGWMFRERRTCVNNGCGHVHVKQELLGVFIAIKRFSCQKELTGWNMKFSNATLGDVTKQPSDTKTSRYF